MRYFLDKHDGFYALDDGVEPRKDWTEISEAAAAAHIRPPTPVASQLPSVQEQLDAIFEGGAAMAAMKAKLTTLRGTP